MTTTGRLFSEQTVTPRFGGARLPVMMGAYCVATAHPARFIRIMTSATIPTHRKTFLVSVSIVTSYGLSHNEDENCDDCDCEAQAEENPPQQLAESTNTS